MAQLCKPAVDEVLSLRRRGLDARAVEVGLAAAQAGPPDPRLTLETARALARCGRMHEARAHLDTVAAQDAGLAHLMALFATFLDLVIAQAFDAAIALARAAPPAGIDPPCALDILLVRARILRAARSYYMVAEDEVPGAEALRAPGEAMLAAGHVHVGLDALHEAAEQEGEREVRTAALTDVAARAEALDVPGLAGNVLVHLAEDGLTHAPDRSRVPTLLAAAERLFAAGGHAHGLLDVRRVRAAFEIDEHGRSPDLFGPVVEAYLAQGLPRGAFSTLLDWSSRLHRIGDLPGADDVRDRLRALQLEYGLALNESGDTLARADLLTREGRYSDARDLIDRALERVQPEISQAFLLCTRSTARSLAGHLQGGLEDLRKAFAIFDRLDADAAASPVVVKLAGDLTHARTLDSYDQAFTLLNQWADKDQARDDWSGVVEKRIAVASLVFQGCVGGVLGQDHLSTAHTALAQAEREAQQIANRLERLRHMANWHTIRASLASMQGDLDTMGRHWDEADAIYAVTGQRFEAANLAYLRGCMALNDANRDPVQHFERARTLLDTALAYYEAAAGMRTQAADARHKLALLHANRGVNMREHLDAMRTVAAVHLDAAWTHCEAVRQAYWAGHRLDALRGRSAIGKTAAEIAGLGLFVTMLMGFDFDGARIWAERRRARALADATDTEQAALDAAKARASGRVELLSMLDQERRAAGERAAAPERERSAAAERHEAILTDMARLPDLSDYALFRAEAMSREREPIVDPVLEPGTGWVEWVAVQGRLCLFVERPDRAPQARLLTLSLEQVERDTALFLSASGFRRTLRDRPDRLRVFAPLVAPLLELAEGLDTLVLCPTGALGRLPLHALPLGDAPLLARHAVSYAPARSVHAACRMRGAHARGHGIALFGDPTDDRANAAQMVAALGAQFETTPLFGSGVTQAALAEAFARAAVLHYQGHAVFDRRDPPSSGLVLADGVRFSVAELMRLQAVPARLVVLAACEGGLNDLGPGDEPLGVVPALLGAGVAGVLAALWNVRDDAARAFMTAFYEALEMGAASPAGAARQAALALRAQAPFSSPYHWAPFAVFGDGLTRIGS